MRKIIVALVAMAVLGPVVSLQAQLKVGVVDMNRVFTSYYKTKDAETKINEARTSAKKELDERMAAYKKNLEEINKLNEEIQKPELSKEMKDEKAKLRDEKIAETKSLEREINEFRSTREYRRGDHRYRQ